MKCPSCKSLESKVIDSRLIEEGVSIRRRRECLACGSRYTTYERYSEPPLMVIKKDDRREPFDRRKILSGINKACNKRNVTAQEIEHLVNRIEEEIRSFSSSEVRSDFVGKTIMTHLKKLDQVAYVRFASVCKKFDKAEHFIEEAKTLESPV
jgi:transcriptional repressor NrdR